MRKEIEKLLQSVQKPARYAGGELNSVMKDKNKVALRYAFCFPDTYEIGMSHLGMKILYGVANARKDTWCERVFAPADDMEALMRAHGEPLFALESGDPIKDFDMIGFTMQYELSYTNILNMLDLAGVPLRAEDRKSLTPIVAFGGPCACNPEPVAEFADIIFLGEGEETTNTVLDLLKECKESGKSKQEFLEAAMHIQGIYVPSFYEDSYNPDGTLRALTPTHGAPATVKKSIVSDMNKCYYPDSFVVPFIDIVHDRAVEEIFRGCIRGCRFCQAGFIYRPIREKSVETINRQSKALIDSTGYDELSLCSLSTSDHSCVNEMLTSLIVQGEQELVYLDSVAQVHLSAARILLTPQSSTQLYGAKAMEEEIISTFTIEQVDFSRDSVRKILSGFAPADDPQVALLIYYDEPNPEIDYYGGSVAGPTFEKCMKQILNYLGVERKYTEEELEKIDTTAPNVTGKTVAEAKNSLEGEDLNYKVMGSGDTVLEQIPAFGEAIPQGGTVVLYTDTESTSETVEVPDLTGMSLAAANQAAVDSGVQILVTGAALTSDNPVSQTQDIEAGTKVRPGTVITVGFVEKDQVQ